MPLRLSFVRLSAVQQPLLPAAVAFICGLLVASRTQISICAWIAPGMLFWLVALAGIIRMNRHRWEIVAILMCGCFAAGGALWTLNKAGTGENRVRRLFERGELKLDEPVEVRGVLNLSPELAPDRIYLSIAVERVATFGRELPADGPADGVIRVFVPFNDEQSRVEYDSLGLDYGVRIRLLCHLSHRLGYRNPGAPDFDEFLEHRGYDAAGRVKSPLLIERLGEGRHNRLLSKLYHIRDRALAITLRHFKQPASGILAAALFGNRYFLSRDTAETFRTGGTFHLLVISGLHVAMIAMVALWTARSLRRSRSIQYASVLALIWAYALMVGAEPAITRAAVMLSMALIGQSIFRASNGANALAASGIVLLAWQPRDIFNPAFQLSFLTVLMVVVVTGPLYIRFKRIGQWRPSASTPYPPRVPAPLRWVAESLFWDEAEFRREMRESHIRYRLRKSRLGHWLSMSRLQRPLAWAAVTIFTTTGVQAGLLPLMVDRFHRVSIVSPVTNVIEGALLFVLMMAGAIYLMIHAFLDGMMSNLAAPVNALGSLTVRSCDWLLAWRGASFRVPDLGESSAYIFTLYFGAVFVLIIMISEWNPFRRGDEAHARGRKVGGWTLALGSSLTVLTLGGLLIAHPFKHEYEQGRLSITFLDVGQGDAMLIGFPGGSLMMLDAGGRPSFSSTYGDDEEAGAFVEDRIGIAEAAVMPFLWRRGIKRLDWILASHGDADHVEGFAEIVRGFQVGTALRGPVSRPAAHPNIYDRAIDNSKLPVRLVKCGDTFEVDGARIDILAPFTESDGLPRTINNDSIVARITFGSRRFLLTGDIEREAESRLVASGSDLRADVLKVAHHGSKTSSTREFLKRVEPLHAVISVAAPSPYGHPHPEVIGRLHDAGARIWQTSDCGSITISTDGLDLRVETFVKCE